MSNQLYPGWKCSTVALNKYLKNSEHKFFLEKYNDLKAIGLNYIFRKYFNHLYCRENAGKEVTFIKQKKQIK